MKVDECLAQEYNILFHLFCWCAYSFLGEGCSAREDVRVQALL